MKDLQKEIFNTHAHIIFQVVEEQNDLIYLCKNFIFEMSSFCFMSLLIK